MVLFALIALEQSLVKAVRSYCVLVKCLLFIPKLQKHYYSLATADKRYL